MGFATKSIFSYNTVLVIIAAGFLQAMVSCTFEEIQPEDLTATPAELNSSCFSNVPTYGDCEAIIIDSIAVTKPNGNLLYRFFVTYAEGISEVEGSFILIKYISDGRAREMEYFDDPSNINVDYVVFPNFIGTPESIEVRLSVACGSKNNRSNYSKPYLL